MMKHVFQVLVFSCLSALAAETGNVLTNAGFEAGSFEGWYQWDSLARSRVIRSAGMAHGGQYCAEIELDPDHTDGGFLQNVWGPLQPGDPIHAYVWVRTDQLEGQDACLKVEFWDEDWVPHGVLISETVTWTREWTRLEASGTVPTRAQARDLDRIHVVLFITKPKQAGRVYFDDAYVGKSPLPPVQEPVPAEP